MIADGFDVRDIALAEEGLTRVRWAEGQMPVLRTIRERFRHATPLAGLRIGACLHVTTETANLMIALKAAGASITLCASNPLSTQDEVAAVLAGEFGIPTFAIRGDPTFRIKQANLDLHSLRTLVAEQKFKDSL